MKFKPEESLVVPDFTISVHGSSCKYIFFGLILALSLSLSMYLLESPGKDGMPRNRWRKNTRENKTKLESIFMNCRKQK